jgi:hypothetical protein
MCGAGHPADLQLHQPLGRKADHLAQQISVRGLLHEVAQVHHVVGHRGNLRSRLVLATRPYQNFAGDHLSQNLHHARGHYRRFAPPSDFHHLRRLLK